MWIYTLKNLSMDTSLLLTLQNYGFGEKEAKIYLAALELGSSPASTIARHSCIKRVTAYTILKDLKNRWIVNVLERNDITYFSVVSPKILLDFLEQKFLEFKDKAPALLALVEKIGSAPKIHYLEGIGWLETLFADFGSSTEDMRVILWTPKKHKQTFLWYTWLYRLLRKKKWLISRRIITADDVDVKKEWLDDKQYGRKTVVIHDFPFPIHADINIYWPGRISILFFDKNDMPHAIIIENNEVYTTLAGIFEYLRKLHTRKKNSKKK